jgi:histidine phosphotransfer protein HptB
LRKAAHNLKGSSGNLGILRLAAVSAELERQARAGTVDGAAALSALMEQEYEVACRVLDAELRKA